MQTNRKSLFLQLALVLLATSVVGQKSGMAMIMPDGGSLTNPSNGMSNVMGTISFFQENQNTSILIGVSLQGLSPNTLHGWHVHANKISNQNCTTAGGHFNPMNTSHGGPSDEMRHFGDLGNLMSDSNGKVNAQITDTLVTLYGKYNVSGLGLVIHERFDDMGRGTADASKVNGNSGSRIACGNIVVMTIVVV